MINGTLASALERYWRIIKVPHDERTKTFLRQSQSEVVEVNNTSYTYYRQGPGPTVVLVHGLNTNLGSMVPLAQDLVEHGFTVVLFDAPAHGEASGITTDPNEIRDVLRMIARQLGEIHAFVGHSLGAFWTLYAWNDECRAETLVSIAAPSTYRFLVDGFVQLHQVSSEIAEGIVADMEKRFGESVWTEFSPAELVGRLDVPGLIVHGGSDTRIPPAHAQHIKAMWSGAQVEILAGAGHFDVLGSPALRQLVTGFVEAMKGTVYET